MYGMKMMMIANISNEEQKEEEKCDISISST
jgi:hypothetical protein